MRCKLVEKQTVLGFEHFELGTLH